MQSRDDFDFKPNISRHPNSFNSRSKVKWKIDPNSKKGIEIKNGKNKRNHNELKLD